MLCAESDTSSVIISVFCPPSVCLEPKQVPWAVRLRVISSPCGYKSCEYIDCVVWHSIKLFCMQVIYSYHLSGEIAPPFGCLLTGFVPEGVGLRFGRLLLHIALILISRKT